MDFALQETQQAVRRLAAEVLGPLGMPQPRRGPARSAGQESSAERDEGPPVPQWQPRWKELSRAGLLALAVPDWLGGDGLGVLDTAVLVTEIGRQAVPVPALATLMLGVLPVIRWGDRDLQQALLAGVPAGDVILTAAVRETTSPMPSVPATTARLSGPPAAASSVACAGTVSGVKVGVRYGAEADWILVPASVTQASPASASDPAGAAAGPGVVIVARGAGGVSLTRTHSSGTDPEYTLRLDDAPIAYVLGAAPEGGRVVGDLYRLALAGACCLADGAVSAALDLTTSHVASRQQFGKPLAAFQAVAQQIADVYIAARTLHLATMSACWRLDAGRDAGRDVDVAAYWLAGQAPAALRTCHHLHGGIGMDVSYPLPRYSALVRDLVRFVGGTDYRLDQLSTWEDSPRSPDVP
jgi:3-oxo-4-pregnene-20-carboxyl-CoA dehydrogenase alpha subunit